MQFLDVLTLIRKYGPALLQAKALLDQLQAVTDPFDTLDGIKKRASIALQLAQLEASLTETTVDDQVVESIGKILANDELLSVLAQVLHSFSGNASTEEVAAFAALPDGHRLKDLLAKLNIDWTKLAALIPSILQIIGLFTADTKKAA